MQELIKYISDILNIKTDSIYTIQDMTEALSKVEHIDHYRTYIKMNLSKHEYKTGFQKFIILTHDYIENQNAIQYGEIARSSATTLFDKVVASVNFVEFNSIDFKNIKLNGKKYFSKTELEILEAAIGNTNKIIEAYRVGAIYSYLYGYFIRHNKTKRITQ